MPSYARKHQLGRSLLYHVYNRGNLRTTIFREAADYRHFMGLLRRYMENGCARVYHWVIMPNHYHVVIELDEPEKMSKLLAGLHRAYGHYYHKTYGTAGYVWQGRFKAQAIQREFYLKACGRYVERNPVHAEIVAEACAYPYSSARYYCMGVEDGITTESPVFADCGVELSQRRPKYREFLMDFSHEEVHAFSRLEDPQGDAEFKRRLIKEHGRHVPRRRGRVVSR